MPLAQISAAKIVVGTILLGFPAAAHAQSIGNLPNCVDDGGSKSVLMRANFSADCQSFKNGPPIKDEDLSENTSEAPIEQLDSREILGPDGELLSPERQRELRELLKQLPPSIDSSPTPKSNGDGNITVIAEKPRGSIVGDIPAIETLDPRDIKAYGADNIGALIDALGPLVASNQGGNDTSPVVLLNGKRVSSFLEIATIPTEAIERTEVFPEELALRYGFPANQKVLNIVTYENFNSRIGQGNFTFSTDGGFNRDGLSGNYLKIAGDTRYTIDVNYNSARSLLESERDILQITGTSELGQFRTLVPASKQISLNGTVSGQWIDGISSTLNARFDDSNRISLLGLGEEGPLVRDVNLRTLHIGVVFGGRLREWSWIISGNYDRTSVDTLTDSIITSIGRDEANLVDQLSEVDAIFSGSIFRLPAGSITSSISISGETRDLSSSASFAGANAMTDISLSRDVVGFQANFDIPIANRGRNVFPSLGRLSANINFAVQALSDFGSITNFGYGINWSPIDGVNFIASVSNEEGAPSVEQLGSPIIITPNARTFDFSRGETVDLSRIFGGNADLRADDREVEKFGLNAKPFSKTDLIIGVEYLKTRIDNPIAAFPLLTPAIEIAFPDRFVRGGEGELRQLDARPINFVRSDQEQIRWGVNFTRPLGKVPRELQNSQPVFVGNSSDLKGALPPGAQIIQVAPGSASARQFENSASRLNLSLYHTATLVDEILLSEGGATLDLLNGSATGFRGGTPRHRLEFQAVAFKSGLGARISVNWQSGTSVRGVAPIADGNASELEFSSLATVNLNLFANLADQFGQRKAHDWLKGTRVSLTITNLFNQRQDVEDFAGQTPINFQPGILDPFGRLVSLGIRKIF